MLQRHTPIGSDPLTNIFLIRHTKYLRFVIHLLHHQNSKKRFTFGVHQSMLRRYKNALVSVNLLMIYVDGRNVAQRAKYRVLKKVTIVRTN